MYTINTMYYREIPRDLFNESKLLKCMGRLCLHIHDGVAPAGLQFKYDHKPFVIGQHSGDGACTITNLKITIGTTKVLFKSRLNSKSNYPLECEHEYVDTPVFDEDGEYTAEFLELCEQLNK